MQRKKLLSSIIATSMLLASVQCIFGTAVSAYDYASLTQNVVTSASNDGVFWIEETAYSSFNSNTQDGSTGHSETPASVSNEMWSGGAAYYDCFAGRYHDAEYKINASAAGTYKIWYHGSDPTNDYSDKTKLYVNGNLVSLASVSGTATEGTTGNGKTLACAWFIGTVSLVSGENTIRYLVDEKSTAKFDQYRYACIFDCLVLSPSSYEWTLPSITSRPAEASVPGNAIVIDGTGAVRIEESDYASFDSGTGEAPAQASAVATVDTTLLSSGDAHYLWFTGRTHDAVYNLNVTTAGTYKLWYHGSDPTNGYHDKSKILVNGVETSITVIPNTSSEIKLAASGRTISCVWAVAEVTLESGSNTVEYLVDEKATTISDQARYTGLLDCFVVAPSAYEWTSPSISTEPTEASVPENAIVIDGTGAVKIEENDYASFDSGTGEAPALASAVSTVDTTLLSGGDAHYLWFAGRTHDAVYNLNVTTAGTYKLWYHGSDPTNGYHDKSKILVNGVETSITVIPNTSSEIKLAASGKTISCVWAVAEITLGSGSNTVEYLVDEKATTVSDQPRYTGLLDCFVIAPSTYEWQSPSVNSLPISMSFTKAGWIEGEAYTTVNDTSGAIYTRELPTDTMSDGRYLYLGTQNLPPAGANSFYAEYTLRIAQSGIYDVFVRTNHTSGGTNNSPIILSVDGTEYSHTELAFEGWINSSGSDIFAVGWSKLTLSLAAGSHTLKWEVKQKAGTRYFGVVDAVVFMPNTMNFTPRSLDILGTKAEYTLSKLLSDYDLSNVQSNISLPAVTESGAAVTWTTSDPSVITSSGVVSLDRYCNKTATLTATSGRYSKSFRVRTACDPAYTVSGFNISGSMNAGGTVTASADVTSLAEGYNSATLILARYDADDNMLDYDFCYINTLTPGVAQTISASVDIDYCSAGEYFNAYIWNDLDNINPIAELHKEQE